MDKTSICNLALSHIGISKEIANIDTEKSAEANACRRYFDLCINQLLRGCNYPFADETAAGQLVDEDPNTEWSYSYRYPSDCSRLKKILSGTRNDSRQTRIPYKIANDGSDKLIYTDMQYAYFQYTVKINDVSIFPSDLVSALSFLLAFYIAPRLTRGDPFKMGDRAYKAYIFAKAEAEANAFNEQQDEEPVESEFIRDRE